MGFPFLSLFLMKPFSLIAHNHRCPVLGRIHSSLVLLSVCIPGSVLIVSDAAMRVSPLPLSLRRPYQHQMMWVHWPFSDLLQLPPSFGFSCFFFFSTTFLRKGVRPLPRFFTRSSFEKFPADNTHLCLGFVSHIFLLFLALHSALLSFSPLLMTMCFPALCLKFTSLFLFSSTGQRLSFGPIPAAMDRDPFPGAAIATLAIPCTSAFDVRVTNDDGVFQTCQGEFCSGPAPGSKGRPFDHLNCSRFFQAFSSQWRRLIGFAHPAKSGNTVRHPLFIALFTTSHPANPCPLPFTKGFPP